MVEGLALGLSAPGEHVMAIFNVDSMTMSS